MRANITNMRKMKGSTKMIRFSKAELDKILDNHKEWLRTNGEKGERADLRSADLRYADLSYADLRSADLRSADLSYADLSYADLSYADLSYADLSYADLSYADLDYSTFPLWCGGLDVGIDDRQAKQLLYHLVRNVLNSENTSSEMKNLCKLKSIRKKANEFHRVSECGKIEV